MCDIFGKCLNRIFCLSPAIFISDCRGRIPLCRIQKWPGFTVSSLPYELKATVLEDMFTSVESISTLQRSWRWWVVDTSAAH